MRRKVTVVGAGMVGGVVAQGLAARDYADVVVVDIVEGMPQGKSLDLMQSGPVLGYDTNLTGANSYEDTAGSDVVVITSGIARKPGMSRDDLLRTNMGIVRGVTEQVVAASPDCVIIVVANPLDAMCHVAYEASGFPSHGLSGWPACSTRRVFGRSSPWSCKFRWRMSRRWCLGGHGDTMVPLPRYTTVAGIPITELMSAGAHQGPERAYRERRSGDRRAAEDRLSLLRTREFHGPDGRRDVLDKNRILPCSVLLEGEYGLKALRRRAGEARCGWCEADHRSAAHRR